MSASDLTDAGLDELVRLRKAGTAGEWRAPGGSTKYAAPVLLGAELAPRWTGYRDPNCQANARLIAASVNVLLPLVEEVRRLRAEVTTERARREGTEQAILVVAGDRDDAQRKLSDAFRALEVDKARLSSAIQRAEHLDAILARVDAKTLDLAADAASWQQQCEAARTMALEAMRERDEARELLKRAANLLATEWRAIDGYDYHRDEAEKMETNLRAAITKLERP